MISKVASQDYRFSLKFGQGVSQQRDRWLDLVWLIQRLHFD